MFRQKQDREQKCKQGRTLETKAPVDFAEVQKNIAALVRNSANDISQSIH
jgi:hypothetical protein